MTKIVLKYDFCSEILNIGIEHNNEFMNYQHSEITPTEFERLTKALKDDSIQTETEIVPNSDYERVELGDGTNMYINLNKTCFVATNTDGGKFILDAEAVDTIFYNQTNGTVCFNEIPRYTMKVTQRETANMVTRINMLRISNGLDAVMVSC